VNRRTAAAVSTESGSPRGLGRIPQPGRSTRALSTDSNSWPWDTRCSIFLGVEGPHERALRAWPGCRPAEPRFPSRSDAGVVVGRVADGMGHTVGQTPLRAIATPTLRCLPEMIGQPGRRHDPALRARAPAAAVQRRAGSPPATGRPHVMQQGRPDRLNQDARHERRWPDRATRWPPPRNAGQRSRHYYLAMQRDRVDSNTW